jgi:hypothetical protein
LVQNGKKFFFFPTIHTFTPSQKMITKKRGGGAEEEEEEEGTNSQQAFL